MSQNVENDPGPVPPPTESEGATARRIRVVAALHSVAQWITDNPQVPTPVSVALWAAPAEGPDADRLAELDRFAEATGADRYGLAEIHEYAKYHLGTPAHHGAEITYTLATTRKDK